MTTGADRSGDELIEVYLAPARDGRGCVLIDVASGEVKLQALGVPQAWIAAAGQGWTVVRTDEREPASLERRADETLGDWGTRLLRDEQGRRETKTTSEIDAGRGAADATAA